MTTPDPGSQRPPEPSTGAAGSTHYSWIDSLQLGRRQTFIRRHRRVVSIGVVVASVLTCVALSAVAGWRSTSVMLEHLSWWFVPAIVIVHGAAYAGYVVAYHQVVNWSRSSAVGWWRSARVVAIGFGGWVIGGGFAVDRRALQWHGFTATEASVSTIALAALELVLLTPAAWLSALLLVGTPGIPKSDTVPWVIGVPVGLAIAIPAAVRGFRTSVPADATGASCVMAELSAGLGAALTLLRRPRRGSLAAAAIAFYWAADITALWAALQFVSTTISLPRLILAYATGYLLTRRTMPFAGAIVTEVLMAVSLVSVGVPLAAAAPAVLVYRLSDFILTLVAALLSSSALERTLPFSPFRASPEARRPAGDMADLS